MPEHLPKIFENVDETHKNVSLTFDERDTRIVRNWAKSALGDTGEEKRISLISSPEARPERVRSQRAKL